MDSLERVKSHRYKLIINIKRMSDAGQIYERIKAEPKVNISAGTN
jgi:hypothetical protein